MKTSFVIARRAAPWRSRAASAGVRGSGLPRAVGARNDGGEIGKGIGWGHFFSLSCSSSFPRRRESSAPRRRCEEALCGQDCPLLDSRLRGNDTVALNPHGEPVEPRGVGATASFPFLPGLAGMVCAHYDGAREDDLPHKGTISGRPGDLNGGSNAFNRRQNPSRYQL